MRLYSRAALLLAFSAGVASCGGNGTTPVTPPPQPATPPQDLLLEVDRMTGTTPPQFVQTLGGSTVSLADIYAAANVNMRIVQDQNDLPRTNRIRVADLHALMNANSSVPANPGEWKVYMLVVTEDRDDPDTLGIMFDFGASDTNAVPREAYAVFESAHVGLSGGVVPEVLLTSAHELAHAVNLHHTDWEGVAFDRRSTVEGYSLTDSVVWELSPRSVAHLTTHPDDLVAPGPGGLPFAIISQDHANAHQSVPNESYSILRAGAASLSRGAPESRDAAVRTQLSRASARDVTSSSPLRLELATAKRSYTVGEPVVASVSLRNTGTTPQQVSPLLAPEYRFLSVSIKGPGDDEFKPYRPPVLRDGRKRAARMLAPDEALLAEVNLFFSSEGWSLDEPGDYEIQAAFPAGMVGSGEQILSETLSINVAEPGDDASRRAYELLFDEKLRRFGNDVGLYLYFGGGDHLHEAADLLKRVVDEAPDAAQAAAARLSLGSAALQPTIDVAGRGVPAPRIEEATQYLQGLESSPSLCGLTLERTARTLVEQLRAAGRDKDADDLRRSWQQLLESRADIQRLRPAKR